jgi:hypothetical protein
MSSFGGQVAMVDVARRFPFAPCLMAQIPATEQGVPLPPFDGTS